MIEFNRAVRVPVWRWKARIWLGERIDPEYTGAIMVRWGFWTFFWSIK